MLDSISPFNNIINSKPIIIVLHFRGGNIKLVDLAYDHNSVLSRQTILQLYLFDVFRKLCDKQRVDPTIHSKELL